MPPKGQPRSQAQRRGGHTENTEVTPRRSSRRSGPAINQDDVAAEDAATANAIAREPAETIPTVAAESTPKPTAVSSPSAEPTPRLASLRGPGQPSGPRLPSSLDPPVKKLKVQPKAAARRSKEEREAAERAEAERLQARLAESGNSSGIATGTGDFGGRGGGSAASGGVSNRWQTERYSGAGASGFLGGATPAEDKRRREALGTRSRGGGRSSLLSDRARATIEAEALAKVKKEPGSTQGKGNDVDSNNDVIMVDSAGGKKKPAKIKKEQRGPAPYDADEELLELEAGGKRIPIEQISLMTPEQSSDEDVPATDKGKGKEKSKTPRPPGSSLMRPVFINRREHHQRTVGINTEPASATSAEIRKRAKATGAPVGDVPLPKDIEFRENAAKATTKKKTKASDVEFIKNERKWQGVYQDEEEEEALMKIKKEPTEADDAMLIDDEPPQGTAISQDMLTPTGASKSDDKATSPSRETKTPNPDPKSVRKPKPLRNKALAKQRPVLQTAEDAEEWHRFKRDIALIRQELIPKPDPPAPKLDVDGDTEIQDDKATARAKDKKEGTVYTFQLPPGMPMLEDARDAKARRRAEKKEKKKSEGEEQQQQQQQQAQPPQQQGNTPSNTTTTKTTTTTNKKPTTNNPPPPPHTDPNPSTSLPQPQPQQHQQPTHALPPIPHPAPLPHGHIGTLTLDASGFPSATWGCAAHDAGGFRLSVGRASDYAALQEVVLLKTERCAVDARGGGGGGGWVWR